jgi:hypothetical protein
MGKGASGGGADNAHTAAGGSADGTAHGQPGMPMNEVDTFGAKLNSILAADLTAVALAQGSLDTIPLGPLATLMPLLQMAGQLNDPTIKSALKQVHPCETLWCWGLCVQAGQVPIRRWLRLRLWLAVSVMGCTCGAHRFTCMV